jgi:hypothetical protein
MSSARLQNQMGGPAPVAVAPNVWIRNLRRTRSAAGVSIALSLVFIGIFFFPNPHLHKTLADNLMLAAFCFGIGALGLTLARRVAAAGVRIGPQGVEVRGPLKMRRVPLAEADCFVPGVLAGLGNGTPCPMLKRTYAQSVGVWALGREGLVFRYGHYLQELQPLCDELNELLKSVRSTAPT